MSSTRVFTGLAAVRRGPARAVVTVGVFDGLHVAHRRVVQFTVRLARKLKATSVVVTFHPDPHAVLDPRHAPPALMPLEARVSQLQALGVDWILILPFTRRFARMSAERFVQDILLERLHAVAVVVGEAFAFGRSRRGDMTVLRRLGPPAGMRIVPVRSINRHGARVSSSRIRQLIARGRLGQAATLLGRPPALYGTVVQGAGRGRRLGVPTANLRLMPQVLPPKGVYAVRARMGAARRTWSGAMNLGVRPTFGLGPLVCEVHLLRFAGGSLLGRPMELSLLARLRAERRFPTPAALQRQVRQDLAHARRFFR